MPLTIERRPGESFTVGEHRVDFTTRYDGAVFLLVDDKQLVIRLGEKFRVGPATIRVYYRNGVRFCIDAPRDVAIERDDAINKEPSNG